VVFHHSLTAPAFFINTGTTTDSSDSAFDKIHAIIHPSEGQGMRNSIADTDFK